MHKALTLRQTLPIAHPGVSHFRAFEGGMLCADIITNSTPSNLHQGVARHLRTILDHGRGGQPLYTFGWLLDTARGLYTLRHDAVVSKTAAGEWALAEGLCPDPQPLELALSVRKEPALIRQEAVLRQAELLTPAIQRFAAVLQRELEARRIPIPD